MCGEEASGPECFSPGRVIKARQFQDELEEKEAQELAAKEARKVQREINKEQREAKEASTQLAKELLAENHASKKASSKDTPAVAPKAKKSAAIRSTATKEPKEPTLRPKSQKKAPKEEWW